VIFYRFKGRRFIVHIAAAALRTILVARFLRLSAATNLRAFDVARNPLVVKGRAARMITKLAAPFLEWQFRTAKLTEFGVKLVRFTNFVAAFFTPLIQKMSGFFPTPLARFRAIHAVLPG
jgi:hypothetical protein